MKNLFSSIRSWFFPKEERISEVALLRMEYESRIQHLEITTRRLAVMLQHGKVDVTVSEQTLKEHFDAVVSESVMKWLANWADDLEFVKTDDLESAVSDAVDNYDFTDAVDTAIGDKDWDYELRHSLDWDKVAERVSEKLDWETIMSENDIVTTNDYDFDDFMLKSDHLSEDDIVTRDDLSDMVVNELKRDWFEQKLKEEVLSHFKSTLQQVRDTEESNCRNAIDDAIEAKLDLLLAEQMRGKFGPQFDIWFHNLVAHAVKTVMGEMVKAAYEQVVSDTQEGGQS
jgi:hypothetical protein